MREAFLRDARGLGFVKRTTPGVNPHRLKLQLCRVPFLSRSLSLSLFRRVCLLSAVAGLMAACIASAQTSSTYGQIPTPQLPSTATLPSPGNATTAPVAEPSPTTINPETGLEVGETEAQHQLRLAREAEAEQLRTTSLQPLLPPEPPSPFQKMVEATTGERLQIYGASLFQHVPTSFAPVEDVPVGPDYVVGPGDEIRLQVSGQVNRVLPLTVDRTGSIQVPDVGSVHVAGLTYGELPGFLNRQLGRIFRNFTVSVSMGSLRTIQVFVVGQARRPGSFTISSLSTLLNALFVSGGPSSTGSLRDIQVKRNGQTIAHFDLYDLLLHGDKSNDIRLATGDVIFIPYAGPQVAVLGSVNHAAIYELKGQTSVAQALEFAGGESALASGADVLLERVYEHENRNVELVSGDQSKTEMVQGGDILSVRSVIDRFRNAVTLRGNVANPGRYAWRPGMKVSDLIPNRESLVTRDYWRKRNQLGQFLLEQSETPDQDRLEQQAEQSVRDRRLLSQIYPQTTTQQQQPQPEGERQRTQTETPQTTANSQYPNQLQPYDQLGPPLQGLNSATASQQQGALQMRNEQTELQRNAESTSSGGNSAATALAGGSARFAPKNDVVLSAPDIDWGYAVIERQDPKTLTTSLIPFNLGKLVLDGDTSQDVELLPGDVVTIFSKADIRVPSQQQTRYVRLEGEIAGAGVYSVQPGETLRGLLRRAGGFTPEAYLYASEFTRESTRRLEQQRLYEYADELEAQLTAAGVATQIANATVDRLRRVRPIGRIVLDLKPNSAGIDAVPDIALEDGDRFIVPRVPSNVTVEGQVYSANAFIYTPGKRVRDYLHQAGGPDRQADHRRMFVLRADGSVVSQQYADVKKAAIYPGDTIVVPPVLQRGALIQRVLNYAQLAGNLALSAAALAVLAKQ